MNPLEPRIILVPTDLSDPAAHALRYASSLAERVGARLLVIYADPFTPPTDFTANTAGAFELSRDAMMAAALAQLRRHVERNVRTGVPFDLRALLGAPLDVIVAQVAESGADLVVMGTHGRTSMSRLMFGSVTEAVMRVVAVPVIAVNPLAADMAEMERVLCAVDFTPACRDALRQAAALVSRSGAPLILLHAVDDARTELGIEERKQLHDWLPAELADRCETKVISSLHEADRIVETAAKEHAQLIALGVPAGRSATEPLLGTIAERVVQRSRCPVLTVNPLAERARMARAQ